VKLPHWVPPAVKTIAEVLPYYADSDIARRLLTDERMDPVWKSLKRAKVAQDSIDQLDDWQRLRAYDIPVSDMLVPIEDEACAAFFAGAVVELNLPRDVLMRSQIKERSERWLAAAGVCREIMDTEPRPKADPQLLRNFAIVESYLKTGAAKMEQRNNAYVLLESSGTKPRGDELQGRPRDELRVKVRALALEMHKIYGQFRYGTVAKVTNIALLLEPEIKEKDVRNWCDHLV
jgi:hypothetical protein